MRGEPNSVVCQFASKPSGELGVRAAACCRRNSGDRQDERNIAEQLLAGEMHRERAGAAQADAGLERTRGSPVSAGASGAFASTSRGALAGVLLAHRLEAGHPCRSVPSIVMLSVGAQPGEARLRAERDCGLVPDEAAVLVGDEIAQPRFRRHHERAAHVDLGVVDGRVEQAALALLRVERRRKIEPRRRDLDVLRAAGRRPDTGSPASGCRGSAPGPSCGVNSCSHAVLPRLALLDQVGDEQVRQDGRDGEAGDQRDLVERERGVVGRRARRQQAATGCAVWPCGANGSWVVSVMLLPLVKKDHSAATSEAAEAALARCESRRRAACRCAAPKSGHIVSVKCSSA